MFCWRTDIDIWRKIRQGENRALPGGDFFTEDDFTSGEKHFFQPCPIPTIYIEITCLNPDCSDCPLFRFCHHSQIINLTYRSRNTVNIIENNNPEMKLALGFLQCTSENVFLTGNAGTGKTTFLHNLRKTLPKRMVVLAPTGVAALNAGGVTIHSFFQMPFGPCVPNNNTDPSPASHFGKKTSNSYHKFSREKLNIIRSLDLIVIDEISMVRADLLDGIDEQLRRIRGYEKPFGGVQLLMIGDLQQLAPVVKDEEWEILKQYYDNPFFFKSKALMGSKYVTIELKKIYRQTDQEFIILLNKVRYGDKDPQTLKLLNNRYQPGFNIDSEGSIILTTHNYQAKRINNEKMAKLPGPSYKFKAKIEGEFPEYSFPTDQELEIRPGAQVMFVKNDSLPEKRFFNGKIGKVQAIKNDLIIVNCPGTPDTITVGPETWQNARYGLNNESGEIVETVTGTFTQYPLKAAWAITIHKSQGLTFDKVIIDAGEAFAHGQVYVALSRCKTLDGLILTNRLSPRILINDSSVSHFTRKIQQNQPGELQLKAASISYQQELLRELFDFSQLRKQVNFFLKLVCQNRESILQNIIQSLETSAAAVESEIFSIADKFDAQIHYLLSLEPEVEQNKSLNQRIKKAVDYFTLKSHTLIGAFIQTGTGIDIDNKEYKNSFANCLNKLADFLRIKTACLEACREGFSVQAVLEARSKAAIEKAKPVRFLQEDVSYANSHPALYNKLKTWRAQVASALELPEYMIIQNKTMVGICTRLPSSLKELKEIKGLGRKKLKEFGSQILEILSDYCNETGIAYTINSEPMEEPLLKVKTNTKQVTFDLLKSGKNLTEIASIRNLALSTIEGHISHFIASGELGIDQFMTPEKVSEISDYFIACNSRELSTAKEHFGDKISYGELRMVVAHLSYAGAEDDKVLPDSMPR